MLLRIRNMWQFACLCQWFYIFGSAVKFDSIDIEVRVFSLSSPLPSIYMLTLDGSRS